MDVVGLYVQAGVIEGHYGVFYVSFPIEVIRVGFVILSWRVRVYFPWKVRNSCVLPVAFRFMDGRAFAAVRRD